MALFINNVHPYLQILNPATGEFARFQAGRLEIAEDDPNYAVVMAWATRDPNIAVIVNETTCPDCGEVFVGSEKKARLDLGAHRKDVHFDKWLADKQAQDARVTEKELKSRAGYPCDVCSPIQVFGDPAGLSEHVRLLHTAAPNLDDAGNDLGPRES